MAPTLKPWHWPTTQEPSDLATIWESGNILIKNNQTGFRLITQVSFLTRSRLESERDNALQSPAPLWSRGRFPSHPARRRCGQSPGATGSRRPALPSPPHPHHGAQPRGGALSSAPPAGVTLGHSPAPSRLSFSIRALPEAAPREKQQKEG